MFNASFNALDESAAAGPRGNADDCAAAAIVTPKTETKSNLIRA